MKYILLLITLCAVPLCSQDEEPAFLLPSGLGIANQMKYSNDIDLHREIFEDWLNLDYNYGIFTTGIRFDIFQPIAPNAPQSIGKERFADIAYKYFRLEYGDEDIKLDLTAGNFYALFGRGVLLKSYEDRTLRVDNNLLGVKLFTRVNDFTITALSGMPENSDGTRTDLLHAADIEYKIIPELRFGLSAASNKSNAPNSSRTTLISTRAAGTFPYGDMYFEYGKKQNDDISNKKFSGNKKFVGEGFYGNINLYVDEYSLSGEYKYYDNFSLRTNDESVNYNTPPSGRKNYTFLLLNRHPSPLNQSNEQGYFFETAYQYESESSISCAYGMTQTLPASSFYQQERKLTLPKRTQLKELFGQWYHHWNENLITIFGFGYNEELDKNTKNITPVFDIKYSFDDVNTVHADIEHQSTTDRASGEQYYSDVFMLEYLRSPRYSITYLVEMETREPLAGHTVRKMWNLIQFGYKLAETTDLSVLIGSRQAGAVCIGGVCIYEPEFSGIEFKMLTRF